MHKKRKLLVKELNTHLTCSLCGGYYVDATTIIECLHSFCRSCIVRYLESNKFCPVCEVQVHKTKPLLNIRPDKTLQTLVYKLVPGLYQNEMRLRKDFYAKHSTSLPDDPEDQGEATEHFIYSSDEPVELLLEYQCRNMEKQKQDETSQRFLRCPAAVTVGLLKRLYRGKFGLDLQHPMDVFYEETPLPDSYSLVDLAYIYQWKRKGPMKLRYCIYEPNIKDTAEDEESENHLVEAKDADEVLPKKAKIEIEEPLKEVQLEISESGVVSVHQVETPDSMATVVSCGRSSADVPDTVEQHIETLPAEPVQSDNTSPPREVVALKPVTNGIASPPPSANAKKPLTPSGYKTLKHPPKLWNPSVGRTVKKSVTEPAPSPAASIATVTSTVASTAATAPSMTVKAPRFFKARNAANKAAELKKPTTTPNSAQSSPSAKNCIVRESPIQEVAVNLTKNPHNAAVRVSSPALSISSRSVTPTTPRPSSAPSPLVKDDPSSKLRHLLVPISGSTTPTCVTLAPPPVSDNSALRFPSWLAARPSAPYVAHLPSFHLSSPFPFLPPVSYSIGSTELKKTPSSTVSAPTSQAAKVTAAMSLRFPTPTFNLNALQPFGGVIPTLPPLTQSFQHSLQVRSPGAHSAKPPGGGYHHSLPPTVTVKEVSLNKSLTRPATPRRPPALVPIRAPVSVPPPENGSKVEDKNVTVVESSINVVAEKKEQEKSAEKQKPEAEEKIETPEASTGPEKKTEESAAAVIQATNNNKEVVDGETPKESAEKVLTNQ